MTKSSKELQLMLLSEICHYIRLIEEERDLDCYNEILGDTSFLLAGILGNELGNNPNWNTLNWLDDSLIHKIVFEGQKIQLWGVIIWGRDGTTKQWTDPFYCKFLIDCEHTTLQKLTVLFGDVKKDGITYEDFDKNRAFWDRDFYSDNMWNPSERNWKFIFNI